MHFHEQIFQYIISGLTIGAIYALVGLGYNTVHNDLPPENRSRG